MGDEELEILQSEVETALNRMKDRKAPGPDGITVECLKALNNESVCILTKLCNQIYRSGIFPEDLKKSVFVTIPKKPKATECSDFRTISLMSHATKLIMTILLRRIQSKVAAEVSEEQFQLQTEQWNTGSHFHHEKHH